MPMCDNRLKKSIEIDKSTFLKLCLLNQICNFLKFRFKILKNKIKME
jgi:hypothetical protein